MVSECITADASTVYCLQIGAFIWRHSPVSGAYFLSGDVNGHSVLFQICKLRLKTEAVFKKKYDQTRTPHRINVAVKSVRPAMVGLAHSICWYGSNYTPVDIDIDLFFSSG